MAEGFAVEPDMLRGYAAMLARQVTYLEHMRTHIAENGKRTDRMDGVLAAFANGCADVADWQMSLLDTMTRVLDGSATKLNQTADSYAATDTTSAGELDKTYPGGTEKPDRRGR